MQTRMRNSNSVTLAPSPFSRSRCTYACMHDEAVSRSSAQQGPGAVQQPGGALEPAEQKEADRPG